MVQQEHKKASHPEALAFRPAAGCRRAEVPAPHTRLTTLQIS